MPKTSTDPASRHVFVVLNPVAGNSDADAVRQALRRHFAGSHWAYEVYETNGGEHLAETVRNALERGFDRVVAVGGDGTVSGVADGLVHTAIPMGIIPVGTANTLARDLGIPLDLDKALDVLAGDHATKQIDGMQVNDQFFVLNISIGVTSLTIRHTERRQKRRFGLAAYIWNGATWLIGFQPRRFTVIVDDRPSRLRASEVVIANSNVIGMPPFRWGSHVRLDDGKLDVCIVRARSAPDYVRLTWSILLGQQRRDPGVRYLCAERSISINVDQPLPVQGDGEIIGQTPVQAQVVPNALRVIVPVRVERQW